MNDSARFENGSRQSTDLDWLAVPDFNLVVQSVDSATYGWSVSRRMKSLLSGDVASRAAATPVFLLGLYLVLKMSGLTRLAITVLRGTGLVTVVVRTNAGASPLRPGMNKHIGLECVWTCLFCSNKMYCDMLGI